MKTVVLHAPGDIRLVHGDEPRPPSPDEAIIAVHSVGICGTDIHAFRGKQPFFSYPRILGHELGAEVIAVGSNVRNVLVGDRCAVEPYINCQACIACRQGKGNCCKNLRVLGVHDDGGMRERLLIPARKLHVANALAYEQIALVETLSIGAHAVARAQLRVGENVLILGAGPIGLSVIQFVAAAGCNPVVMDVSPLRLAFCRDQLKVAHTIPADENAIARLAEITSDEMATAVFDATGNAASMKAAINYLAHGGRLVYVGLFPGDFSLNDPAFHARETTLLASRNSLPEDFENIIQLIERRAIDTSPWITHRAGISEVETEFPKWILPETGTLKAMLHF